MQKPKNYLLVLPELKKAISEGDLGSFKKLINFIELSSKIENDETLRDYDYTNNPITSTSLVNLACKHNNIKILECLLGSISRILNSLPITIRRTFILPNDEDETCHNAFYYAIRSGNTELLDMLINKWPDNYFAGHLEELDEILSQAYQELKLKCVLLSDKMETFVENKLINLRFFSDASGQDQSLGNLDGTGERIELVLQHISLLKADYSNSEEIDEKFLFVAKSIAQNIHILKWQLKSTYVRLPWEEMEFCLVSFIAFHIKRQEINLFYHAALDKNGILNHLENFANKLNEEKDIIKGVNIEKLSVLPRVKREKVVEEIVSNYPQFKDLYNAYQQIRDVRSLEKISDSIKLALSADPKEREGQLIITRVLQVIGEHLKNTLESPKLSNTTSERLLLSLPRNARKIIVDIRNSLSHAYSLSKRIHMAENADVNYFKNIQNDIKKVGDVITDILYSSKFKTIKILLNKIVNSKNSDEIKQVAKVLSTVELDETILGKFQMMEHERLNVIVTELNDKITDKTNYEKELLNKINSIVDSIGAPAENIRTDYVTGIATLKSLCSGLNDSKTDHNVIKGMKFRASHTLKILTPRIESHSLKDIANLAIKISHSVGSRIQDDQLDEVNLLIREIFYIAQFGTDNIKWIEELREKLNNKGSFISTRQQNQTCNLTEKLYNDQLALKLSDLKNILSNNSLIEKLSSYKSDKKLQAVVEMLVLDIMSILGNSKRYLENNQLFLDDNTPLLIGKCLRNHLAHDNALLDVLLSDPIMAVILNAKKLTRENKLVSKKKIGKLIIDDSSRLKRKFHQGLTTITNQKKMFVALAEGNLAILRDCFKMGSDINARSSINLWTTLHFAAKGPSLESIKFLFDQNLCANLKDINGETPLHIAATHGRHHIVEFLLKEIGLHVDDLNNSGKTPLHLAAQNGHKSVVDVLLRNKTSTITQDVGGISPLHYAIINNHIDVAKVLLEKDVNVDINEAMGGFTPLHGAAESGHLELVNFLLLNKANVNATNDRNWRPLHAAALNGHMEVANALILNGANVNAKVVNGCTPLYYAVENGHEDIANILLKHGANANDFVSTCNNTSLHCAAKVGHLEIVMALLKNGADGDIANVEGITPLHFAVHGGNLEIVAAFLKHGVDIHTKDKNNATPLHYAAEGGHKEVAVLLIKNKSEVNAKTNNNLTPLHLAAQEGHKDVVDLLIESKATVDSQDIKGNTPLHAAALRGSKDIIDVLIKNKAKVNSRTNDGITPLHVAALNGHVDAIDFLIKKKAQVNVIADYGVRPLHSAIIIGHKDAVNLLIKNKAQVDVGVSADTTPLYLAVEAGHKEIVEILARNGANVNSKSKQNLTPLFSAVRHNHKEIVEVLIASGANVNKEGKEALLLAVFAGYVDIVEVFFKNHASANIAGPENATLLHLAATIGHKKMVNILMTRGADVNAITLNNVTPLYFAAQGGYEEVVDILIAGGANVNVKCNDSCTPLHIAASSGHSNVVKVFLDNKAKVNVKDNINRTPLELAVSRGHLQVVKMLLQHEKIDIDAKGNDDYTILHIASQENSLEMVKYLVNEGSNINAKNAFGSKSIHIAAREGFKDVVEFFLSKGLSINDPGAANQTLVHYAAMKGHLEVVKYLITQGADVNAQDTNGLTPMHIAANFGYKSVVEVLLQNGAAYNAVDKFFRRPLKMSTNKDVINLLESTEKLFGAVKRNNISEVEKYIKAGGFVNSKNTNSGTPLHYAAWKGFDGVVNALLQYKANPNIVGNKGWTPLHYAVKFSHLKVVKALLCNSAVYNAVSDGGKTPSDFSVDKNISSLFKLLNESFQNIKNGNSQVVHDLNKIEDINTIKAMMNARNSENRTLVVAAVLSNFSKVEQLKQISQGDLSTQINAALVLFEQGNYQKALSIFQNAFEKRKEILGSGNPGTLDIQTYIAKVLYTQGAYQEALRTFEEISRKQIETLGLNDKDTLSTRSMIGLVLHRLGRDEEAYGIYPEVYQKQKEILGLCHSDTLDTQFHMALVLHRQGKYDEALNINRSIFKTKIETLGPNHANAVLAQNNIAMVLASQGNYEEALKIYQEVFEKKKVILGINHADTLRTLHNIAGILFNQKKYREALEAHQKLLNIQKTVLAPNHPDTLNTQYNMANVLYAQGKWIGSLKTYRECLDQMKAVFGSTHPSVLDISRRMETLSFIFKLEGSELY